MKIVHDHCIIPCRCRILVVGAAIGIVHAQVSIGKDISAPHGPEVSAHAHNADMSCCTPCVPTEADQAADVFKRPCFVHALGKSREAVGTARGLEEDDERDVELSVDRVPNADIDAFKSLLGLVLQPTYLPRAWAGVRFFGLASRVKGWSAVKGLVLAPASEVTELKEGDDIQAEWAAKDIQVLPRTLYANGRPNGCLIRLRFHGEQRLEIGPRPADFVDPVVMGRTQFFDRTAFDDLLTRILRVPFEITDDWVVTGYDATYEGVRVFHGYLVARDRGRVWVGGENPPRHWWEQMRLLVTDSDPQYFCVQITLGEDDTLAAP